MKHLDVLELIISKLHSILLLPQLVQLPVPQFQVLQLPVLKLQVQELPVLQLQVQLLHLDHSDLVLLGIGAVKKQEILDIFVLMKELSFGCV